MLQTKSKGSPLENSLLLRKGHPFVLFNPSADLMRPIHIREGNLVYSKSTNLNANLIHKHSQRNIQNNVWPNIWALRSSQVNTKLNITGNPVQGVEIWESWVIML